MADVFISYKREDKAAVLRAVESIRAASLSVWWDQDIVPDAPWEATIERELAGAKVVLVAWSPASVVSENVKAEARRARNEGKLIQVFVSTCNPPLFFGERQGIDLSGWSGDPEDRRFLAVLDAVRAVIAGKRPPDGVGYAPRKRSPVGAIAMGFAIAASLVILAANVGGVRDALCRLGPLQQTCINANLTFVPSVPATDPTAIAAQGRAALLNKIEGVWGNVAGVAPACSTRLTYAVEHRGSDDYVVVTGQDFLSEARIASAEGASLFTRVVSPPEQAGTQWELRLEADRLIQVDAQNVGTTLLRCGT